MTNILGEEADIGQCEFCGKEAELDTGVICEGCSGFCCRQICFRNHKCSDNVLVTREGHVVHLGDELVYPSHSDVFTVIEMQGTWVKGGYARGRRHREQHEMPVITRLMIHIERSRNGTD